MDYGEYGYSASGQLVRSGGGGGGAKSKAAPNHVREAFTNAHQQMKNTVTRVMDKNRSDYTTVISSK